MISNYYDISKILTDIEIALCIDGKDYSQKDVGAIMNDVYTRIVRHYQIDLRNKDISDESLYLGASRSAASLFVENMAMLHGNLCGYLQVVRYTKNVTIRLSNISYMGFVPDSFESFIIAAMSNSTIKSIDTAIKAIANKFGSISNCIEKKCILIMIVAYNLGFFEIVASMCELYRLGMKM